jgi:Sulfotransferase family
MQENAIGLDSIQVCRNPVFVVGAPRSGTTALAQALGQHSRFWTGGESTILFDLYPPHRIDKIFDWGKSAPLSVLRQERVERDEFLRCLGQGMNALLTQRSGGKRWIDQTPLYTLGLDRLAIMFPGARFLNIVRDGRKVVNSLIHFVDHARKEIDPDAVWQGAEFQKRYQWLGDVRTLCRLWRSYVLAGQDFASRYPEQCLTIVNEQLSAAAEDGFATILRFLNAPYEASPAEYFRSHRVNSSYTSVWDQAAGEYVPANPWLEWDLENRRIFLEEAGQLLQIYGFLTAEELNHLEAELSAPSMDRSS